jgi:hypothetical protein
MRKWLLVLLGMVLAVDIAFAAATNNAYQIASGVRTGFTSWAINFPYPSRNIIVKNQGASWVWIDVTKSTTTTCAFNTNGCTILKNDESIELYDFITNGISILNFNSGTASPVSVVVTY